MTNERMRMGFWGFGVLGFWGQKILRVLGNTGSHSPHTAYECAQTLFIHMIWMWDAFCGGLEPQLSHDNITRTQSYPNYSKNLPPPAQV